jgi:hypothetical protein
MKALVSSLALLNGIKEAINAGLSSLEIEKQAIHLYCSNGSIVVINLHIYKDFEHIVLDKVDQLQWRRMADFLISIPEQPIVIEINQYEDDKISIEFSQFIARF